MRTSPARVRLHTSKRTHALRACPCTCLRKHQYAQYVHTRAGAYSLPSCAGAGVHISAAHVHSCTPRAVAFPPLKLPCLGAQVSLIRRASKVVLWYRMPLTYSSSWTPVVRPLAVGSSGARVPSYLSSPHLSSPGESFKAITVCTHAVAVARSFP